MSADPSQNKNIRVLSTLTGNWIHELPPPLSENKLLEACTRDKSERRPFKKLCSMIMERLLTFQEGSVFLLDDIRKAFPEKNAITSIYHLCSVLEGLGYVSKDKSVGTFVWFGPGSDRAAKTLKDLKTVAINQEGSSSSIPGDTLAKLKIARLTEEVLMIFLSISPLYTISMHQVFFLVFNKKHQPATTAAFNVSRVFKVLEVLGIISSTDIGANYQYTGPTIESHASFEEIGKIEVDGDPIANVEDDDVVDRLHEKTVPIKKIVLGTDGVWTIQEAIPVGSDDKIDKENEPLGNGNHKEQNHDSKSSKERREVCQSFVLVDVEDEILKEMLD